MFYSQESDVLNLISCIICYLRKSRQDILREKRTGEDTLTEQDLLMNKVLKQYEKPYEIKREIGSGDKISTRPIFQGVLKELNEGKWDAVAVKEISRLGRGSYGDMGQIFDLIVESRIFIITPYKIYDPDNPADRRQIRFELFLSREEFETTKERLTGSRYNYAMQGKWMAGSSIPYGYKLNKETVRLEPDEETVNNIKLMFDLYVNGLNGREMAFRAIATYFRRLGIKTAKGKDLWSPQTISRMIQNVVYIGQERYRMSKFINGKREFRPENEWIIVNDAHEPIINENMWYDAQQKFKTRSNNPRVKMDFAPCELAGLIVCSKCKKKMVRMYSVQNYKKKDGEITQYHKEFLWCCTGCGSVKYRDVEDYILAFLEALENIDENTLFNLAKDSMNFKKDNSLNDIELLKQSITDKKSELKNRLIFIKDKYESGIYSDEEFIERRAKINREIEDLKKVELPQIHGSEKDKPNIDKFRSEVSTFRKAYYFAQDKTERNILLRQAFDTIELIIISKGRGRISTKFEIEPHINIDFLVKS
jgi:DNA invertase Pin-like site-specific DNA recombinase